MPLLGWRKKVSVLTVRSPVVQAGLTDALGKAVSAASVTVAVKDAKGRPVGAEKVSAMPQDGADILRPSCLCIVAP